MASLSNNFLLKYYFNSYLNYVLLKDISKFVKDESIASQFDESENSYVKLICMLHSEMLSSIITHRYYQYFQGITARPITN